MREILLSFTATKLKTPLVKVWDINERLDLKNLSNILYILQLITEKEFQTLNALNSMRNEIIHKYFYTPYDDFYKGVSKAKFLSIFKPSFNLSNGFIERIEAFYDTQTSEKKKNRIKKVNVKKA
jgi:uncharacterized protein YutE (UPF0331/DUF86 family)